MGLVYVWRKGDLNWIKPTPVIPTTNSRIPSSLYEQLNIQQSKFTVRKFSFETIASETVVEPASATATATNDPAPVKRPMFKPTFKKPANDA